MTARSRRVRRLVAGMCGALALGAVRVHGQACGPSRPEVNKTGFRAGATVPWRVARFGAGEPFPDGVRVCVARAFEAWTDANTRAGLEVRFVPGHGGIVVRLDLPGGSILTARRAGGWSDAIRASDGALEQANIWLTSAPALITSCEAVTKTVLHELGHLHGLADNRRHRGPSVMNSVGGRDDRRGRIPLAPTACDVAQAALASSAFGRGSRRASTSRAE